MKIADETDPSEDMRNRWNEYKQKKDSSSEESVEKEVATVKETETKKEVSQTEQTSEESSSSEEDTEFVSDSESSNEDKDGNADDYANQRRIPAADVNLDTQAGFSTGLSGLREAEIQKFRQNEKKLA